jgi:hypothetical protein
MIEAALSRHDVDLDKLAKLLELQERWEANEARKAYHEAMARFKANPPGIEKDRTVSYAVQGKGTTTYRHASLANVTNQINKALSEHGLSAAWRTDQSNGTIKVTCTVTHVNGHSESTSLEASPDTSGSKNFIQAIGSTISYLERYTILALTGLATHDLDDDGNSACSVERISEEQLSSILDYINNLNINESAFCKFMKVERVEHIKASDYNKAIAFFRQKEKKCS